MFISPKLKNIPIANYIWRLLILLLLATTFIYSESFINTSTLPQMYWYIFVNLLGTGVLLGSKKIIQIKLDALSLSLLIFVFYLLIRLLFSSQERSLYAGVTICFLLSYVLFKNFSRKEIVFFDFLVAYICFIISLSIILEEIIGISFIKSFSNPAGQAVCMSIGFPFFLYYATEYPKWKYYYYGIALCTCIAMLLLGNRTGILAILIIILIYSYNNKILKIRFNIYFMLGILLFLSILTVFFFIKYDSAIGRILVWRITWNMFLDYPVWGMGYDNFIAKYMLYQAEFFKTTSSSTYELLADNVLFSFNEYLSLLCEFGIVGACLFALLIWHLFFKIQEYSVYIYSLIAIAIFACFSYPLHYLHVVIILSYILAVLSKERENVKWKFSFRKINMCCRAILLFLIIGNIHILIKDLRFEYQWKELVNQKKNYTKFQLMNAYEELFKNWNGNPFFLYNYGADLRILQDYEKSNFILHYSENFFNDYDLQLLLAHNCYDTKNYNKAKQYYWLAHYMCPNRFIPLYRLSLIYEQLDNREKVQELDSMILNKKIKVPSLTISQIRAKIKKKYNLQQIPD